MWDWKPQLTATLDQNTINLCYNAIPLIILNPTARDSSRWEDSLNMALLVKSLRSMIESKTLPEDNFLLPRTHLVPLKVKAFAWRAGLDRIPSLDNLIKRCLGKGLDIGFNVVDSPRLTSLLIYEIPHYYEEVQLQSAMSYNALSGGYSSTTLCFTGSVQGKSVQVLLDGGLGYGLEGLLVSHSGPAITDYSKSVFEFSLNGLQLQCQGDVPTSMPSYPPDLQRLLNHFAGVFQAPTGLPSTRSHDHHIELLPTSSPVSVWPYRYPHFQKQEIEWLVNEMLQQGIIRPNRFPIPSIDELFDELHDAHFFSKLDVLAGYHQIRIANGDAMKTTFRTHDGYY
ncbi:hypothetical protein E3N88_22975 [Mikania micrantha]|uniref:Reverse transcriptase domain-containing protein n=1 Tax=Mikania micrantha TaxID=192012 RepID=A0A5N6NC72_9ASTR|nr:hypothetical protein E3N88_22975 [Mikania micrantha]